MAFPFPRIGQELLLKGLSQVLLHVKLSGFPVSWLFSWIVMSQFQANATLLSRLSVAGDRTQGLMHRYPRATPHP